MRRHTAQLTTCFQLEYMCNQNGDWTAIASGELESGEGFGEFDAQIHGNVKDIGSPDGSWEDREDALGEPTSWIWLKRR